MKAHQQQQEMESVVCPEREVMGASEAGPEHEQAYGNQAAIEALCEEPIDIDVVDRDGSVATLVAAGFAPDDTQVDVEGGVRAMVDDIILLAGARPIRRLTITSHGRPGTFGLGHNQIQPMSPPYMMLPFAELAPLFDEGGFVELHSCSVADGEAGERLLAGLHQLLGVPIIAGTAPQIAGAAGFEGSTLTATEDDLGEPIFERDEHPIADVFLEFGGGAAGLFHAGVDAGEESLTALAAQGSRLLEGVELPEVGDLEQWLFGV